MKFDHDILFDFLPEEDKKSFMVWVTVFSSTNNRVISIYRAPFEDRLSIPLDEYELRVKQKERNTKLDELC